MTEELLAERARRIAALEAVVSDALVALPVLGNTLERIGCYGGARVCREMLERAIAATAP